MKFEAHFNGVILNELIHSLCSQLAAVMILNYKEQIYCYENSIMYQFTAMLSKAMGYDNQ